MSGAVYKPCLAITLDLTKAFENKIKIGYILIINKMNDC